MQNICIRRRPYQVGCTGSLSTSEVKRHRARLVLGWGTAWEDLRVLSAFSLQQQCLRECSSSTCRRRTSSRVRRPPVFWIVWLNRNISKNRLFAACSVICRRPYRVECTGSLLASEVKRHRARLVLGWGTAWEDLRVLSAFVSRCGEILPHDFIVCL